MLVDGAAAIKLKDRLFNDPKWREAFLANGIEERTDFETITKYLLNTGGAVHDHEHYITSITDPKSTMARSEETAAAQRAQAETWDGKEPGAE
jgi:hypothetical protein